MIFDIIDRKIEEMKKLRRQELIKANHEQQIAVDTRYKILVSQVTDFANAIEYARNNLNFTASDVIQPDARLLLENLKKAVSSGYADKEIVIKAEADFKSIQNVTKKEWYKHFISYTATTTNTLRVICGIDEERINACIDEIKKSEVWTADILLLASLKKAMGTADGLIKGLNMDQETILFLTNITSGKATLADLKGNVLKWIKEENLESKIKLSF